VRANAKENGQIGPSTTVRAVPEVPIAVRSPRQPYGKAGKAQIIHVTPGAIQGIPVRDVTWLHTCSKATDIS
jgi:hypothetical protein